MKRRNIIILLLIVLLCITGCGNNSSKNEEEKEKDRYSNIAFENLKTYTEITKIKPKEITEEVGYLKCIYQVNNKDDKNITKYKDYLTEKYGFTYNSKTADRSWDEYNYQGKSITFIIEEEKNNIYLQLKIDYSDDYLEKNVEKKYNEAMKHIDKEEYAEARSILFDIGSTNGYFDYKDKKRALAYTNGMMYKKTNAYGSAIESFNNAKGFKDADIQRDELKKIVSKYNGTWFYDNPKYPKKGIGYYIYIKDGRVAMELESMVKDGYEPTYLYALAMKHNDENEMDEFFIVSGTSGLYGEIEEKEYGYLLYEVSKGKLLVSGRSTAENFGSLMYGGVYTKKSNGAPDPK